MGYSRSGCGKRRKKVELMVNEYKLKKKINDQVNVLSCGENE